MGGQGAAQQGAHETSDMAADIDANEPDGGDEMEATETATEPAARAVATDDLEQFSGAQAHPSEPVTRPAEAPADISAVEPPLQGPEKTDPDTQ
jgi:hypothetical protein